MKNDKAISAWTATDLNISLKGEKVNSLPVASIKCHLIPVPGNLRTATEADNIQVGKNSVEKGEVNKPRSSLPQEIFHLQATASLTYCTDN